MADTLDYGSKLDYSLEAEEAVCGSLLVDHEQMQNITLSSEDFFQSHCAAIFEACQTLLATGAHPDEITVYAELKKKGKHKDVPQTYLETLMATTPTSLHCTHYAKIVREHSVHRQMVKLIAERDYTGIDALLKSGISTRRVISPKEAANNMLSMLDSLTKGKRSISWGFRDLDKVTGGLYPGELTIIGARPSVGKTEVIQQSAVNLSESLRTVLFCSVEMPLNSLQEREISSHTEVNIRALRDNRLSFEDRTAITNLAGQIGERPLYHLTGKVTSLDICQAARLVKAEGKLDAVFVDYLQLLADCSDKKYGDSRDERVGNASHNLKQLAAELSIPVVVAAQLNRGVEFRDNKRPTMADLRESGNIEQDADVILLLFRPELYDPNDSPAILEIKQAKNRQLGPAPVINLKWQAAKHRYFDNSTVPELEGFLS